ncbi:mechanosensitive ion channel protein MscS [Sulfitobacter sp. HI0082]|jgi:small conductance mechanosensitive channel|uniref:mechanosensitive ion channel family protein n=1 Tax=unclassified Sulfitobacter TaxID=196795 RepID=UPI0007C3BFEE|nr:MULTISPECIES: mechanosensitive ion channel domain-containing protein [unclassified Sulfitobacter]KZZ20266.1 mechanosensitive ion channel protein MscS [Sulfitobacter sp. HI0082]HAC48387.1 mechanosensitive ion channel protein MscS [Sulfitobacter sp.]KZX92828.1 mechanosensitive ion channel protein MscS [Sulfitobacter sp. HI0021]KZX96650.1 mechanosensitive ion channel protein MscS [Sulfitobacter sp. HI0027]KZZ02587.1 mechanosensitive ion channel protein MscS [Sulfitobacter sp. HI0076]|tara:strand:- start:848 stop:1693 length:846 start_codon:yes stop_codon:yes gene_type:complete
MQDLFETELWQGKTIADLLTLEFLASAAGSVIGAIVILLLGWIISSWLQHRVENLGKRHKHLDEMLFEFLASIVRYVVLGFTVLFVLNTFGVKTTSVVAVIGAAGLAIGLALQGTLSNVAAGVMLILFRPIKIGDFVVIAGEMGTVKQINLNYTVLADLSNVQVIVPNSEVWGNVITNYSVNPTRRAEWTFGVGYGANLKTAEEIIRSTIMADERAHADPEPFIQVNNLNDSSVDFLVRVWCSAGDYFAFKADMTRKVKEALDEGGVDIPFPTRTIVQAAE